MWRIETDTGDQAYQLEQAILCRWRDDLQGAPVYERADMPQWGLTETVSWDVTTPAEALAHAQELISQWGLEN